MKSKALVGSALFMAFGLLLGTNAHSQVVRGDIEVAGATTYTVASVRLHLRPRFQQSADHTTEGLDGTVVPNSEMAAPGKGHRFLGQWDVQL
jgi:hypothetical protein